jgi:hypothetical protein
MKELGERKRLLLVESEINRQILRLESQQVRMRVNDLRGTWLQSAWAWSAPLAGFFVARKFIKSDGFFARSSALLALLTQLWGLWQRRRAKETRLENQSAAGTNKAQTDEPRQ